jgi:hypothetical protein
MFPELAPFRPSDASLIELGAAMEDVDFGQNPDDPRGDNHGVPAGYTYFGQFVDHDITFDKTIGFPPPLLDPTLIEQARTPTLDLDSLYGMGPVLQPELYEPGDPPDRARFRIGRTSAVASIAEHLHLPTLLPHDLPRAPVKAVIADTRNDEHLLVAQMHLAWLQFHNKVLGEVLADPTTPYRPAARTPFDETRRIVTWHYQWLVINDWLPRITRTGAVDEVLGNGARWWRSPGRSWNKPYMPVEFSVAAYRMGHSMIRQTYEPNRAYRFATRHPMTLAHLFFFTGNDHPPPNLFFVGIPGAPIITVAVVDWRRFFEIDLSKVRPNPSRRLDTRLANPLRSLPEFRNNPANQPPALAQRNLLRGSRVGLPSGQDVAAWLGVTALSRGRLRQGHAGEVVRKHGFDDSTPLWYYILREAEVQHEGTRLGEVGSRIIAETVVGLLEGDPDSYLAVDRNWRPTLPAHHPMRSMADLMRYIGNVNPIGD